jgi:hypothetical protein
MSAQGNAGRGLKPFVEQDRFVQSTISRNMPAAAFCECALKAQKDSESALWEP